MIYNKYNALLPVLSKKYIHSHRLHPPFVASTRFITTGHNNYPKLISFQSNRLPQNVKQQAKSTSTINLASISLRNMTIPTEPISPFHCVHVYIKVKPGMEDAFIEATLQNARESTKEEGVVRFDFYQDQEYPNQFVLVEVYKNSNIAPGLHKETVHYLQWRDTVSSMMEEERTRRLFTNLYPTTIEGWQYPSDTPLE